MNAVRIKEYDILDLTKIILSFMVVAIHTKLLPLVLYPWIRLAVPLFFIISSFILYTKINNSPKEDKNNIIKHYIMRLIKLYLFWFIALLPITIYLRRVWFEYGILIGILNIIIKPFLGSTFIASWYIMATIIGTLIVNKLCNKISYKILILLFIFINLICCSFSSYSFLFKNLNVFKLYIEPYCSFPVSLIYILLGKLISENKIKIENKKINLILLLNSCIILFIEWLIIYKINGTYNNDCYIFLIPTSFLVFNYIIDINIKINKAKSLRQLSNFIYPLHGSIAIIISKLLEIIIITQ